MNSKEINTKEQIIRVATELFASNGFEGTSVRDIATSAKVNLAAVNYHFKNKENLYFEVFNHCYQRMEEDILNIGKDKALNTQEFSWKVLEYFVDNGSSLLNTFRIIFSEKLSSHQKLPCISNKDEMKMGPPGKEMILEKITEDVGDGVPISGRHWAMRVIFANVFHFSLMSNIPFVKNRAEEIPFFLPNERKRSIYFLVDAVLSHLKQNISNWE